MLILDYYILIQNNKIINNIYEYDCFDEINGNVELIYLDEIDIEDVDKEDVVIAPLVNITKKMEKSSKMEVKLILL